VKRNLMAEEDPVERVRRVRNEIAHEFKTLDAYCDYIRELDRKDPKTNPALRRKKAKIAKATTRRPVAPVRTAHKRTISASKSN